MKRGFIFGAVIVLFFAVVTTLYFTNATVYNLSKNFNSEVKVIDYGKSSGNYESIVADFVSKHPGEILNNQVYFILGDSSGAKVFNYQEFNQGSLNLAFGGNSERTPISMQTLAVQSLIPKNNKVEMIINGENYDFKINQDEVIYLVLREDAK